MSLMLFCGGLILCVALGYSILYALAAGLLLFALDARHRGFAWQAIGGMMLSGVRTVKQVLLTFFLIGVLTALWRAGGTVATMVCYASRFMLPSVFLLFTFLLNSAVSMLMGTAFGTAATMGVICAMMGRAMGIDPLWTGGAVLSGVFVGDRCSPVSTSALLIATLTETDIFQNIRAMLRTGLLPFVLAAAAYALMGLTMRPTGVAEDARALFEREFVIGWAALLPAAVILLMSMLRVNVKISMAVSILMAAVVSLLMQQKPPQALLKAAVFGYTAANSTVGPVINGGGMVSMLRVASIVCLSSAYSGLFQHAGLLDGVKGHMRALANRVTLFGATLITALLSSMIACNQSLAIMMTHQLCADQNPDAAAFANDLEDTVVVIAPWVPWSIASAVPLGAAGAPTASILTAFFLFLLPLCRVLQQMIFKARHKAKSETP